MLNVETINDKHIWNNQLRVMPYAHILQTWEWGEFKRVTTGWHPLRLAFKHGSQFVALASVGVRKIGPIQVMYVSKGPALAYADGQLAAEVLTHLQKLARRQCAVWLKIDPDVIEATGVPGEADDTPHAEGQALVRRLKTQGWFFSPDQVQFRNTITIDLTQDEETLLAQMSQSTRRKVRTGEKKGVTVRAATTDDLDLLYHLYKITGERDHFLIRPAAYYQAEWRLFMEAGMGHALIAEAEGRAVAHVILLHFGRKCWYFYGASANDAREKMPNYLLQWEAIRWAKAQGYTQYDLWGAPNYFAETDSMWGVYQFKRGFRGTVTRYIGAWDYAPYPPLNYVYTRLMPRVIRWMRSRGTRS